MKTTVRARAVKNHVVKSIENNIKLWFALNSTAVMFDGRITPIPSPSLHVRNKRRAESKIASHLSQAHLGPLAVAPHLCAKGFVIYLHPGSLAFIAWL
jgi:hypothetical protein